MRGCKISSLFGQESRFKHVARVGHAIGNRGVNGSLKLGTDRYCPAIFRSAGFGMR